MNNLLEKRIQEKYPNEKVKVLKYTKMREPTEVQCETCKEIYSMTMADNFLRKNKTCICLKCQDLKRRQKKYQEKINLRYPNEKILITEYNGAKGFLKVKCLNCGNEESYQNGQNIFLKHKKRVCTHCFPNKREALENTKKKFQNFIKETELFKDFKIPEKINADSYVESTCTICGKINKKTMYDYMRGKGCSCQGNNVKLTLEEYQKRIGEDYELLSPYKGLDHSVLIKHKDCGFIFKANAKHTSCPKCKGSNGEKTIRFWLKENNFNFIEQYGIEIKGHKLRFDFYLPDYDLYIEYQGEQHFKPVDFFGGEETFKKQQLYDKYKKDFAKEKLIEIKFDENILSKLNEQVTKNPLVQQKTTLK